MPGIMTSSSTISGFSAATRWSACSPLEAVMTLKYSAVSFASSSLTFETMSSTTRTRAVMAVRGSADETAHGFQETRDGDRFGKVSFATPLTDHLRVALHSKSGDGHYRNR